MPRTVKFVIVTIVLLLVNSIDSYNGPIAGNKSIHDCIKGGKSNVALAEITPHDVITDQGYPAEDHIVLTEDGYLLTLNRIPGPVNAPAVLLHHGFSSTSIDWLASGKNKALAFLLADKGYDVWLANARGGFYSSCHVNYTTEDDRFWDFSFHEIGVYDLPAEIMYIKQYQNNSFFYIGHSMGTTVFYVMASEKPDLATKITLMFSFAPIAFFNHINFQLRAVAVLSALSINIIDRFIKKAELYPPSVWKYLSNEFCSLTDVSKDICLLFEFALNGYDFAQFNETLLPLILSHHLVPTAEKIKIHYLQIAFSGKFRKYDYGKKKNLEIYNISKPPEYNLTNIRLPVGLFWSDNDFLSTAEDVRLLHKLLPLTILYHKVGYSHFNHLDYLFAINAPQVVYSILFNKMEVYR